MKAIKSVFIVAGLFVTFNLLHAQTMQWSGPTIGVVQPAQNDSIVQLAAESQGLAQVALADLPRGGTFWFVTPGGIAAPFPCPPQDANAIIYQITDTQFLVDQTGGQVAVTTHRLGSHTTTVTTADALTAQAQAVVNLIQQLQEEELNREIMAVMGLDAEIDSPNGGGMSPMFSLISSSDSTPVYLANLVATRTNGSTKVTFSIAGGTNGFAYDIFSTTNLAGSPVYSQWTWLGQGYTSNNYTFNNQPLDNSFYTLAIPRQTMVIAWGEDTDGQCDVPAGLTNAIDVAAGDDFCLALKADGTVVAWGDNIYGECNVPVGLTNVASIAAGGVHALALLQNGTVVAWGGNTYGETNVPVGLTNVVSLAVGEAFNLALRNDGTIVAWGSNNYGQTNVSTTGIKQIAAAAFDSLILSSNGTVAVCGYNDGGVFGWNITSVPAGLSNVVALAGGHLHVLAAKTDGTMTAWGAGKTTSGYENYGQAMVPVGLSNVVALAAGGFHSMALRADGTAVAWGDNLYGESIVPDRLTGVKAIATGFNHSVALRSGSMTPVIFEEPVNQYAIAGATVTFSAYGEGVAGVQYQWQFNGVNIVGATGANLTLTNVQAANVGSYQVLIVNVAGYVTSDAATFTLITPPVIVSQAPMPTNQVTIYQTNLTLSVAASAPGQPNGFPLHYQWKFNGANIGANTASCVFNVGTNTDGAYSVLVTNAAGSTSAVWQVTMTYVGSYIAPGTLAYYLSTNTVAYASWYSGSSADETVVANWTSATYSSNNMTLLTNAVWSTNFWLKGVQGLSATPIGTSNSPGGQTLITMVSPRHYLRAHHTGGLAGMTAFLDTNNVIYWRTSVQQVGIGNDTDIGILNEDLPSSVGFLPVIPTNAPSYLPTNSISYVQGIGMNQKMRLFGQPMTFRDTNFIYWNSGSMAPFGLTMNWNVTIVPGDSSNPEMFLIGNQLVLVSHNFNTPNGPNYAYQIDAINQQMHYLSTNNAVTNTDYQLIQFSLTNWPTIH